MSVHTWWPAITFGAIGIFSWAFHRRMARVTLDWARAEAVDPTANSEPPFGRAASLIQAVIVVYHLPVSWVLVRVSPAAAPMAMVAPITAAVYASKVYLA